jgi:putative aldouronate transport system permease protein
MARTSQRVSRPWNRYRTQALLGQGLVHGVLILIGLACVIPMMLVISISLSSEKALVEQGYSLLPVGFSTAAYDYILQKPGQMLQAYGVTGFVTIVGTGLGLLLSSMLAWPLARQDFKLRGPLSFYVFFTLLFSGGMVPFYILVTRYLGLKDNVLALILPYLVTAWYVLILRTSFAHYWMRPASTARGNGASSSASLCRSPSLCWRQLASFMCYVSGMIGSWPCSLSTNLCFTHCNTCSMC